MKSRRLMAVVFTDIVGFSAMVNFDETSGARALDLQRRVVRKLVSAFGGREIETAGDSFLLCFGSAFAAIRCVAAIHRNLAAECARRPDERPVTLRASVHLGDIEHRGRGIFGDGVNIAARLLPLSPEGGIALSDQVHSQVRHRLTVTAQSMGQQQLKNIRHPVEVFVLDREAVTTLAPERTQPARRAEDEHPTRWWLLLGAGVLAITLGMGLDHLLVQSGADSAAPAVHHPTIAVLPFQAFSATSDDGLLASGVQDSVLTNLARIDDLRVISRTSMQQYANRSDRSIRQIGRELGAGVVVEGSLQRVGNRVRVQVQMIDAATDRHLWAQTYERTLSELFDVESDIARQVAEAAEVKLTGPVRAAIAAAPTRNVDAYSAYLKAEALIDQRDSDGFQKAGTLLVHALELDPGFALAHVELSYLALSAYFASTERTEAQLQRVRDELMRAGDLQPQLPELHRGWGNYYFYGRGDKDSAVAEFESALQMSPNDPRTLRAVAGIYVCQGHLQKAQLYQRRVVEIDPRAPASHFELMGTQLLLHDFGGVQKQLDQITELAPDNPLLRYWQSRLALLQGNIDGFRNAFAGVDDPVALEKVAYFVGDFDEAIRQIHRQPSWVSSGSGAAPYPSLASIGVDLWLKGDHAGAASVFRELLPALQAELQKADAAQWDQHGTLAIALAVLGQNEQVDQQIAAIRSSGATDDPVTRGDALWEVALAQHISKADAAALATLDEMLSHPSDHTLAQSRIDPAWRTLRDDLRFQRLHDFSRQDIASRDS